MTTFVQGEVDLTAQLTRLPSRPEPGTRLPDEVRRQELAAFLRSRRERISPEQVGLPVTTRRRSARPRP